MHLELCLKGDALKKKSQDSRSDDMDYLRNSTKPIVIFGGGNGGKTVAELLLRNNVEVNAFCESAYYFQEGKTILDRPVYVYDKLKSVYSNYELVLGASGKSIYKILQNEEKNGNDVFAFDDVTPAFEMSYEWVKENTDKLEETLDMLADDLSKETFLSFIEDKAHCLNMKITPLWKLWIDGQYFNDLYDPSFYVNNVMVDCGAWIGDTAEAFLAFLREKGYEGMVYAFEPEPDNYKKLTEASKKTGRIKCYQYAVGNEKKKVSFATGNSSWSCLADNISDSKLLDMIPVDEILKKEIVSFIKMDLEGGEENALLGMRDLIVRSAPYMAICVYHKVDDLIRLPRLIRELAEQTGKAYKYYLRHHSSTSLETVFYAVPQ